MPILLIAFIVTDAAPSQPLPGHVIAPAAALWLGWSVLRAGETAPSPTRSASSERSAGA